MFSSVGTVSIDLEARLAKFESDMGRAARIAEKEMQKLSATVDKKLGQLNKQFESFGKSISGVFEGALAGLSVGALGAFEKHLIDVADNINDLSKQFGVSTQALSVWRLSAEKSGTSLDGIAKAAKFLSKDIAGSSEKLKTLGISMTDATGKAKPMESVIEEVAQKFAGYQDGTEKAEAATALFGKAGAELIPFLDDLGGNLDDAKDRAAAFGVVIGQDLASAADQFNDNARDMAAITEGFGLSILKVVLPPLNDFISKQIEATRASGGLVSQGQQVGDWLKQFVVGLVIAKNGLDVLIDGLKFVGEVAVATFEAAADQVGAYGKFAAGTFSALAESAQHPIDALRDFGTASKTYWTEATTAAATARAKISAAADAFGGDFTKNISDVTDAFDTFGVSGANMAKVLEEVDVKAKAVAPHIETDAEKAKRLAEAEKEAAEALRQWKKAQEQYDAELLKNEAARIKQEDATIAFGRAVKDVIRGYDQEIELLGLDDQARDRLNASMKAEEEIRKLIQKAKDDELNLSPQYIAQIENEIRARAAAAQAAKEQAALAKPYQDAWKSAVTSVAQAFGDFAARGFKGWKGFLDSMKQALKRWIADVIALMAQRALLNAFSGQGGGWLSALGSIFGSAGGAGGGLTGTASNLFGGFFSGGGSATQAYDPEFLPGGGLYGSVAASGSAPMGVNAYGGLLTGETAGGIPYAGIAGGIGGAFYGYNHAQGGLASVGAAASYGALGFAAGTALAGGVGGLIATGSIAGAGAGAVAAGSGAFASLGAAAWIPVVGWILAAAAVVDLISGGKLFGTKFKAKGFQQGIDIGPTGGNATLTVEETRQRALFGGTAHRTRSLDPGDEAQAQAAEIYKGVQKAADEVGSLLDVAGSIVAGTFTTVLDKKGKKVKDQFSTVLGKKYKEDAQAFATRLVAEAQIATVDAWLDSMHNATQDAPPVEVPPGTVAPGSGGGNGPGDIYAKDLAPAMEAAAYVSGEASRIAERWRGSATELANGAAFLVNAAYDMKRGTALLGDSSSLTQITDLIEDLQRGDETLTDTYLRAKTATALLDEATSLMGVDIGKTREEVVRFATAIADSAGGIDQATKLWNDYFENFFSKSELAQRGAEQAAQSAAQALADIGLDPTTTKEQLRAAFESALPTLSPEQIASWLEAASALAAATNAQDAYNQILDQTAQQEEQAAAARQQATDDYAAAVTNLGRELVHLQTGWEPSAFVQGLAAIRSEESARIAELNRLAKASGLAGASERDLALVHQIAAVKASQAIIQLQAAAQSLISQLYGPHRIGSASSSSGFSSSESALGGLDNAASEVFRSWTDALKSIRKFLDDILLDTKLTTLTPQQQLDEAQRQYAIALAAAQGGDAEAAAKLPELAKELLDKARGFYASGDQYDAIFHAVTEALSHLTGTDATGGGGGGGVVDIAALEQAAQDQQAAAEEVRQQRLLMAVELAGYLRDLGEALGQNVLDLAGDMGVKLTDFVTDLGIDLTHLSTETAEKLAGVANTLGVELPDLADKLGISLGQLSDENSYINDALEAAINAQPPDIRDELEPFFDAITHATNEADANAAIADLEDKVNEIGGSTALALAPYLENVDPPSMEDQIAALEHIDDASSTYLPQINTWLAHIAASLDARPDTAAHADGVAYVRRDHTARVHAGEKILDPQTSAMLDRYGIRVTAPTSSDDSRSEKLEMLVKTLVQEAREANAGAKRDRDDLRGLMRKLAEEPRRR